MFVFQKIWPALFSWITRFEISPFTLLSVIAEAYLGPSLHKKIRPKSKETADLVKLTKENLNGELHFLWSAC